MDATIFVRRCMQFKLVGSTWLVAEPRKSVQPGTQNSGGREIAVRIGTRGSREGGRALVGRRGAVERAVRAEHCAEIAVFVLARVAKLGVQLQDPEQRGGVATLDVHMAKVCQHAAKNLSGADGCEVLLVEWRPFAVELVEHPATFTGRECPTACKRVDEPLRIGGVAHEEMARQGHAVGDRDAGAAVDDAVEERVPWVVIMRGVPGEREVAKEQAEDAVERAVVGSGGERVEAGHLGLDGHGRLCTCRDDERRFVEADLGLGLVNDCRESVHKLHRGHGSGRVGRRAVGTVATMLRHEFLDHPGPIAVAHRGGAGVHPENTMEAFAHAVSLGYRYLETDAHLTHDGHVIAFHDERLDRVTDRFGRVGERTLAEIREARIGGTCEVVVLEELLAAFPDQRVNIDPKSDAVVEPLARLLGRTKAVDRVCIGSFSDARLAKLRGLLGHALCTSGGPRAIACLRLASMGVPVPVPAMGCVQVPVRARGVPIVDARFVRAAHRRHLAVHVWTIDDPVEMHRLLDLGVDGIMTDQPAELRAVLRDRGAWIEW